MSRNRRTTSNGSFAFDSRQAINHFCTGRPLFVLSRYAEDTAIEPNAQRLSHNGNKSGMRRKPKGLEANVTLTPRWVRTAHSGTGQHPLI
jgi:hypothetical protein